MSRVFDALQKSGLEQTGVEYPDMVSVATKVFESPTGPHDHEQEAVGGTREEFPVVEICVPSASRLVFLTEPESLAAEKFRFLGVRMRQLQQNRSIKRVLVTSSIAEEGKSLVSANLAGVLARRKKQKVLLIEGDLRRPTLAHQFGLHHLKGLCEWLQTDSQTVTNVYYLEEAGFWLMPAGHPPSNPLELMQSPRLSALMNQLATVFDWIIVDSPPLLPLADTTEWGRLTDGALLVVREGTTEKKPLQRGLEMLKKADLLGVVLNGSSNTNHRNYYQRYSAVRTDRQG